jgi:hypothetical protein
MAVREVIHFRFGAQLSPRPLFRALSPPKPVAEPPLAEKHSGFLPFGRISTDTLFVCPDEWNRTFEAPQ